MRNWGLLLSVLLLGVGQLGHADYYSCQKKVYEAGWLRKYDYKGQTWAANTKKSGALTSTVHVSTENTTTSVDPGVTSGKVTSSSQYSSSWGECAMVDIEISFLFRDDYIQQNLDEIKKQVAIGQGYHVESLAVLSGCGNSGGAAWNAALQSHTGEFYDAPSAAAFRTVLDQVIERSSALRGQCHPPQPVAAQVG